MEPRILDGTVKVPEGHTLAQEGFEKIDTSTNQMRELYKDLHPDNGGDMDAFIEAREVGEQLEEDSVYEVEVVSNGSSNSSDAGEKAQDQAQEDDYEGFEDFGDLFDQFMREQLDHDPMEAPKNWVMGVKAANDEIDERDYGFLDINETFDFFGNFDGYEAIVRGPEVDGETIGIQFEYTDEEMGGSHKHKVFHGSKVIASSFAMVTDPEGYRKAAYNAVSDAEEYIEDLNKSFVEKKAEGLKQTAEQWLG